MAPSTPAEHGRAKRREPVLLVADRVVRPVTRSNRAKLLEAFDSWLAENHATSVSAVLAASGDIAERVAGLLVGYGQALFRGGHPYYKYSETINAVASAKPSTRRGLSYAWDLAFAWLTEEPHCHQKAMPVGVLLALFASALAWGWAVEAALFGIAWAGLLRPGELFAARRSDLVLPRDSAPGLSHALVVIQNPKTRGRAARHQSARIHPVDIIQVADIVFGHLPPTALLWRQSAATRRRRLEQLQQRLGLVEDGRQIFDLSSFRPGGATWMLGSTENSELVRRRGRWLSQRVMDIYLQEVVAITFLPSLSIDVRDRLEALAGDFCTSFAQFLHRLWHQPATPPEPESISIPEGFGGSAGPSRQLPTGSRRLPTNSRQVSTAPDRFPTGPDLGAPDRAPIRPLSGAAGGGPGAQAPASCLL